MINFLNPKLTKMKRNRRHINLYSKFLKKSLKKKYYSRKLENRKPNMKKTWHAIKQVIGKTKTIKNDIPKKWL